MTRGTKVVGAANMISIRDRVYQSIVDLCMAGRQASRKNLIRELGFRYTAVDDAVKQLKDDGRIRAVLNGVYEPVLLFDEYPVSATVLSDGRVKLECGDEQMILTPSMARNVVSVLGGFVLLFGR